MIENIDFQKKSKNQLIIKRRRRKFVKKCFILLILLISTLTGLCLKHPYFNVKKIEVINNKNISKEEIIKLSRIYEGDNIFYINMDRTKRDILNNPYILKAEVKRKLPNKILIDISEREAIFYGEKNREYIIVDKNGVVLEIRKDIKNMNLVKLQGFQLEKSEVGKTIFVDDDRKVELIKEISLLVGSKKDNYNISLVNLQDLNNIQFYYKNILIKLGNSDELNNKLNKAFNIILQKEEVKSAKKGYVDVSFNGNPVVFIEK